MKYIQNNKKYAMAMNFEINGAAKEFRFDCRRIYQDTGNVATTGETPIEDSDVEYLLQHCEVFKKLVEKGDISILEEPSVAASEDIAALEEENAILKEENAALKEQFEAVDTAGTADEKELIKKNKELVKEVASLKKRLEAAAAKEETTETTETTEPTETTEQTEDTETGSPDGF